MVVELYMILIILGLVTMASAFFISYDKVHIGMLMIAIGGVILLMGIVIIPVSESVTFCEEYMDGVYEYNDGLDTCTIQEGNGLVTYKLMDEEPYLSRFASQEKAAP